MSLSITTGRVSLRRMSTHGHSKMARPLVVFLSLVFVSLFAYANFLCVAGSTLDSGCDHPETAASDRETSHQHDAPASKSNSKQRSDCGSHASCFCITMNTVIAQPTVVKPSQDIPFPSFDLALTQIPGVIPVFVAVAYERGPPALGPPVQLFFNAASSRAPPILA
jgi:hypothetical protein